MKKVKQKKLLRKWLQQHPAARVHHYLRELLTHYISFSMPQPVHELSELVLDITAVMELMDTINNSLSKSEMNKKIV